MSKGKLIIISAPSGSGKTTIAQHLIDAGLGLEFSVSATTRESREHEVHRKDYYFLSDYELKLRVEIGDFLEWQEVYPNHLYGTLHMEVDRIRDKGNHVLFDVDVVGGINLKKAFGDEALSIFVMPPSIESLDERLSKRSSESTDKIKMRVEKAEKEMSYADQFDLVIVNDKLESALADSVKAVKDFLKN